MSNQYDRSLSISAADHMQRVLDCWPWRRRRKVRNVEINAVEATTTVAVRRHRGVRSAVTRRSTTDTRDIRPLIHSAAAHWTRRSAPAKKWRTWPLSRDARMRKRARLMAAMSQRRTTPALLRCTHLGLQQRKVKKLGGQPEHRTTSDNWVRVL